MAKTICCPIPTAIASTVTTLNPCRSDVGQIQKLIFWRRGNTIASVATAEVVGTWTTLLSAADATKAIPSPFIGNVELPNSEAREFGGGNETRDGAAIIKGSQNVPFSGVFYMEAQTVIAAMKQLECESLDVLFVNESNQIIYSTTSTFSGFQIINNTLYVSDKSIGGYDVPDQNMIKFSLAPNWSDTLAISSVTTFALDMVNA